MTQQQEYALIFWVKEKLCDIVEINCIPLLGRRQDALVWLDWENYETMEKVKAKAKILAISRDKQALDKLIVDTNGKIDDLNTTIVTDKILAGKRKIDQSKSHSKKMRKETETKIGKEILEKKSMFNIAMESTRTPKDTKAKNPPLRRSPRLSAKFHNQNNSIDVNKSSPQKKEGDDDSKAQINYLDSLFPGGITRRDIERQRTLLSLMETLFEPDKDLDENCNLIQSRNTLQSFEIPPEFTRGGPYKVELFEGSGIFFHTLRKRAIEDKAIVSYQKTGKLNFNEMIKEALTEIFGGNLKNYSAKGRKIGSRPGIPDTVSLAVKYWVTELCFQHPTLFNDSLYTKTVNDIISNRRKGQKNLNPPAKLEFSREAEPLGLVESVIVRSRTNSSNDDSSDVILPENPEVEAVQNHSVPNNGSNGEEPGSSVLNMDSKIISPASLINSPHPVTTPQYPATDDKENNTHRGSNKNYSVDDNGKSKQITPMGSLENHHKPYESPAVSLGIPTVPQSVPVQSSATAQSHYNNYSIDNPPYWWFQNNGHGGQYQPFHHYPQARPQYWENFNQQSNSQPPPGNHVNMYQHSNSAYTHEHGGLTPTDREPHLYYDSWINGAPRIQQVDTANPEMMKNPATTNSS